MNNILLKILCAFFIVSAIKCKVKAGTMDTIRLANNITTVPATATIIKIANIVYPVLLEDHKEESLGYIQKFSNTKRDYLIRMYQKGKNYFPKVISILKKYNLPQELKVLLALESGFNANAVSGAGAVGYWQMMDEAARDYGLKITTGKDTIGKMKSKDDRKNFSKSTMAAAKYFRDRSKIYNNDILLMVASYNCGNGNVSKAIKRSGKAGANFWDIKKFLPAETRNYVMNFISLSVIFANYEKFSSKNLIFTNEVIEVPLTDNNNKLNTIID